MERSAAGHVTRSSHEVSSTINQAAAVANNSDFQEYDNIQYIQPGTGTKYQNQTRTQADIELEYDEIYIKPGTGTKYQNQTQTKMAIEEEYDNITKWTPNQTQIEEEYDDIAWSGIGTKHQNPTSQTEAIILEYDYVDIRK